MPTVLSGYGFAADGPHLVLDDIETAPTTRRRVPVRDTPLALIQTVPGLVNTLAYLDARRALA